MIRLEFLQDSAYYQNEQRKQEAANRRIEEMRCRSAAITSEQLDAFTMQEATVSCLPPTPPSPSVRLFLPLLLRPLALSHSFLAIVSALICSGINAPKDSV